MLNNPTIEKLKDLKLKVMAQMMSDPDNSLTELSFEERLGIMVEKEWIHKKNGNYTAYPPGNKIVSALDGWKIWLKHSSIFLPCFLTVEIKPRIRQK